MPTTSNFGWTTPADTDLVKDGAAAIRTLGNGIDTSLVDLKGGTTGQVLSKASNTDLDYTWVTTDDANAIQNAIVDAKGDLIAASANDTPARLAVGNNGETLVADSSATTGLRYQAPKTQNAIYNSSFDIAQRGTSFTTAGGIAYTLDRWQSWTISAGGSVVTTQETGTSTSRYAVKLRRSTSNTDTGLLALMQTLETTDSFRFQNQTVTLSFWAKAGANFSAASSILQSNIKTGTGTDQNGSSFTGSADNVTSHTLTTSWQKFTSTKTLASNLTELALQFYYAPVGTAGADDSFFITGIQLEVGSVATPYNRMSGTLAGELAACQRYYFRQGGNTIYQSYGNGYVKTSTQAWGFVNFPVPMRVAPTSFEFSNLTFLNYAQSTFPMTSVAIDANINSNYSAGIAGTISGGTAGHTGNVMADATTSSYVGFSAEL